MAHIGYWDMTTLYQQFNTALQRRLEANLVSLGELVATEVRRNIQKSPRGGKPTSRNPKPS